MAHPERDSIDGQNKKAFRHDKRLPSLYCSYQNFLLSQSPKRKKRFGTRSELNTKISPQNECEQISCYFLGPASLASASQNITSQQWNTVFYSISSSKSTFKKNTPTFVLFLRVSQHKILRQNLNSNTWGSTKSSRPLDFPLSQR